MQVKHILLALALLFLLFQCKKSIPTVLPEAGKYEFSVNIKDYDVNGKLTSELNHNIKAELKMSPTQDTIWVEFEKWFDPIQLVQTKDDKITIVPNQEEFVVNNLDCNNKSLEYQMVHRTGIQQYSFEGKKQ